jgi:Holliday junction DNA helicase RuvA
MINYYGPITRPKATKLADGQFLITFQNTDTGIVCRLVQTKLADTELRQVWLIHKMDVNSGEFSHYAFGNLEMLALFNRLRDLSGVGVTKAADIILKSESADVVEAVRTETLFHPAILLKFKGLPPKARMELEAELPNHPDSTGKTAVAAKETEATQGAVGALVTLGYARTLAKEKVMAAAGKNPQATTEQLVKLVLKS